MHRRTGVDCLFLCCHSEPVSGEESPIGGMGHSALLCHSSCFIMGIPRSAQDALFGMTSRRGAPPAQLLEHEVRKWYSSTTTQIGSMCKEGVNYPSFGGNIAIALQLHTTCPHCSGI
jgi:hypothetical protein